MVQLNALSFAQSAVQRTSESFNADPSSNLFQYTCHILVGHSPGASTVGKRTATREPASRAIMIWKTVSEPTLLVSQQKRLQEAEQLLGKTQ